MEIEFDELAHTHPKLKAHFRENGTFDFDKPGATYDLTEAIMKHLYGVSLTLDRAKLCPRVPNRLSYLQWCQACVAERKALCKSGLRAVDIGTGSSAIYPILGVAIDPGVRFTATELDQSSLDHANTQIIANGLTEQIEFVKVDIEDVIINDKVVGGISSGDTVLFTLCNPPFYCSMEDMSARGALKPARRNQLVASDLELVHHDGGEVGFAEKYIEQSLALQHASFEDCFFTCQLGSFGSFKRVSKLLQSLKAKGRLKSYVGHELSSGKVGTTKRWVLGWLRSSFRYPASRAAIATQPLTSRFDTLVKFEYAKVWFNVDLSALYLKTHHPRWTRRLTRMAKFKKDKLHSLPRTTCIFRATPDEVYWVYGTDKYSWESLIRYLS